jgi:hypothetical protein
MEKNISELQNIWKGRKIVQKKCSFNNEIKCQERHRMQDFAPFIPELLGATQGPQTIKLFSVNWGKQVWGCQ